MLPLNIIQSVKTADAIHVWPTGNGFWPTENVFRPKVVFNWNWNLILKFWNNFCINLYLSPIQRYIIWSSKHLFHIWKQWLNGSTLLIPTVSLMYFRWQEFVTDDPRLVTTGDIFHMSGLLEPDTRPLVPGADPAFWERTGRGQIW
jgi:hypothetical protein